MHAIAKSAVPEAEDLMQSGREVGTVVGYVPIPQAVIGATGRQGIALLGQTQSLVSVGALDGAGNKRGRRRQHVNLQRSPDSLDMTVVEAKKAPAAAAHHDRHRNERQGVSFLEHL